jgi:hypothetical protein
VCVGYTPKHLKRRTVEAILAQQPHAEFFDISGRPDSYYEMFKRLWADQRDFMLIEHDIVIRPNTLEVLDACPEPWCSCPIGIEVKRSGREEAYFQCNRWRAEVMIERPDVTDLPMQRRHWGTLDAFLLARMRGNVHKAVVGDTEPIDPPVKGFEPHVHMELATHHEAPFLGSTGAITTIGAWRAMYQGGDVPNPLAVGPRTRRHLELPATGVTGEEIVAKLSDPRSKEPGDGVAYLRELGRL